MSSLAILSCTALVLGIAHLASGASPNLAAAKRAVAAVRSLVGSFIGVGLMANDNITCAQAVEAHNNLDPLTNIPEQERKAFNHEIGSSIDDVIDQASALSVPSVVFSFHVPRLSR
jgi:hypothetical protein